MQYCSVQQRQHVLARFIAPATVVDSTHDWANECPENVNREKATHFHTAPATTNYLILPIFDQEVTHWLILSARGIWYKNNITTFFAEKGHVVSKVHQSFFESSRTLHG